MVPCFIDCKLLFLKDDKLLSTSFDQGYIYLEVIIHGENGPAPVVLFKTLLKTSYLSLPADTAKLKISTLQTPL